MVRISILVNLLFVIILLSDAGSTTLQKMNLEQIVYRSQKIFVGKVTSAVESSIPGPGGGTIPITIYKLAVSESLDGIIEDTVVVKHVRLRHVDPNSPKTGIPGFPVYQFNEKVILFLTPESKLGLSAPVGLLQGVFRVRTDSTGDTWVANGINNEGLFAGMESRKWGPPGVDLPEGSQKLKKKQYQGFQKSRKKHEGAESRKYKQEKGALAYTRFVSLVKEIVRIKWGGAKSE